MRHKHYWVCHGFDDTWLWFHCVREQCNRVYKEARTRATFEKYVLLSYLSDENTVDKAGHDLTRTVFKKNLITNPPYYSKNEREYKDDYKR